MCSQQYYNCIITFLQINLEKISEEKSPLLKIVCGLNCRNIKRSGSIRAYIMLSNSTQTCARNVRVKWTGRGRGGGVVYTPLNILMLNKINNVLIFITLLFCNINFLISKWFAYFEDLKFKDSKLLHSIKM